MKLLVVEDDVKAANALAKGLREEGFVVDVAADGDTGLVEALHGGADLVILDVALPGADGWSVLKALRAAGNQTPVLMLTARDALDDKVKGLTLGADDYIVKPYAFTELVARARAVLRRKGPIAEGPLAHADLIHDPLRGHTRRGETRIDLTQRESQLLELLLRHKDEVLSRSYIAERVWEVAFEGDSNVVDTSIWRLRAKIDDPFERKLIHTVRGRGYVLR
ncbi:DNA-binding heavy metal response regulator [alpha proteobacterium U9-1i]|nr:DNA-binding heavy metal response regulator [alpha proteobacterium U9-1i]